QGAHGVVVNNGDGTFTYTHDGSETTSDSFTYTINDGSGGIDTATVNVTITPVNDAPVVANVIPDQAAGQQAYWSFQVPANAFFDPDSTLTFSATLGDGSPLPAWLTFAEETQTFYGTPPQDFLNSLQLRVTASDGSHEASDTFNLVPLVSIPVE